MVKKYILLFEYIKWYKDSRKIMLQNIFLFHILKMKAIEFE